MSLSARSERVRRETYRQLVTFGTLSPPGVLTRQLGLDEADGDSR